MKVLHKDDANLFTHFCRYIWQLDDDLIPLQFAHPPYVYGEPIHFTGLMHLASLSLIQLSATLLTFTGAENTGIVARYHGRSYKVINNPGYAVRLETSCFLTDIGEELAPIAGSEPDDEYRERCLKLWRDMSLSVEESSLPVVSGS